MLGRALVKGQLRNAVCSQDNVLLAEKGWSDNAVGFFNSTEKNGGTPRLLMG